MRYLALALLATAAFAQDKTDADRAAERILAAQQHESMERRAQHREIEQVQPKATATASVDHRSPELKASDDRLLAAYMKLTPTGRLVPVTFSDGKVLYVPEVK